MHTPQLVQMFGPELRATIYDDAEADNNEVNNDNNTPCLQIPEL